MESLWAHKWITGSQGEFAYRIGRTELLGWLNMPQGAAWMAPGYGDETLSLSLAFWLGAAQYLLGYPGYRWEEREAGQLAGSGERDMPVRWMDGFLDSWAPFL